VSDILWVLFSGSGPDFCMLAVIAVMWACGVEGIELVGFKWLRWEAKDL
jgi:hypothetical protein